MGGSSPIPRDQQERLEALLQEGRLFQPSEEFRRRANASESAIYERADRDLEGFWAEESKRLDWFSPWEKVLEWNTPWVKWFAGAKLNVTYNCVDRHAASPRRRRRSSGKASRVIRAY